MDALRDFRSRTICPRLLRRAYGAEVLRSAAGHVIPLAPVLLAFSIALPRLTPARAEHLARDIAAEADSADEARALVSTLVIESGGRGDVESCRVTGDHGRAWSLYQLNADAWKEGHSKKEICASNRLATHLAARALRALGGSHGHWESALAWYVGRGTSRSDRRIAARVRLFRLIGRTLRADLVTHV